MSAELEYLIHNIFVYYVQIIYENIDVKISVAVYLKPKFNRRVLFSLHPNVGNIDILDKALSVETSTNYQKIMLYSATTWKLYLSVI